MGIFDGSEISALTCSTFCLVCIGGRSSMNLMVSMGVSSMVPSHLRIQSTRIPKVVMLTVIHWACTEFCSRHEAEFQLDM